MDHRDQTTSQLALSATVHCLPGCAIGEILGLVIAPSRVARPAIDRARHRARVRLSGTR